MEKPFNPVIDPLERDQLKVITQKSLSSRIETMVKRNKGGRMKTMSPEERSRIARLGAKARWARPGARERFVQKLQETFAKKKVLTEKEHSMNAVQSPVSTFDHDKWLESVSTMRSSQRVKPKSDLSKRIDELLNRAPERFTTSDLWGALDGKVPGVSRHHLQLAVGGRVAALITTGHLVPLNKRTKGRPLSLMKNTPATGKHRLSNGRRDPEKVETPHQSFKTFFARQRHRLEVASEIMEWSEDHTNPVERATLNRVLSRYISHNG